MSALLDDLENLKAAGVSEEDRELRLEQGTAELHSLLDTIRREAKSSKDPPVSKSL